MNPLDLDRLAPEALPGVRVLPVVHDRLEAAAVARAVLDALDPAAVAVELPTTLSRAVERAVARLPEISVILSEEPGGEALVWAVAPGDPFAEALRWAAERDRGSFLIDPDLPYAERHADPIPDPYAVWELGPAGYLAALADALAAGEATDADLQREAGMAYHVQRARRNTEGTLLVLVGAAHARRLAERLSSPAAAPFARTRRPSVAVRHLHPESLTALLPDPPLAHAAWELLRPPPGRDRPELPPEPPIEATAARRLSLLRAGFTVITRQEEGWGGARRRRLAEAAAHRARRTLPGTALEAPDRWALGRLVWAVGARSYREQTREEASPWQRRMFFDYAYRHARCQGQLVPGLYEWAVAGRGVGDDNLAWEIFEVARSYPWQEELSDLATAKIDGDQLDLGTRKVRFRRRFFRVKRRPVRVPVARRPSGEDAAKWLEGFRDGGLCSYPPEDLVIEDYGRFLRKKAVSLLSAERTRVEPFTTSMLDGIDLRETLRHLIDDRRIRVREMGRAAGAAGSVVVIFDRDLEGARYPHLMTWLGEHDDESDMAFYSTHPAEQVVGPGILRATYGGFLMTIPRGRLFEIWHDPEYHVAREKAEVLLMAGVDYSEEKHVVHVAQEPPAEVMRRYAAAQGKKIVHIPLGSLSPLTLKKIRVLHILAGRDKRAVAKRYVW